MQGEAIAMFRIDMPQANEIRAKIRETYRTDEEAVVERMINAARLAPEQSARVQDRAYQLVARVRKADNGKSGIDALLHEYELSSKEGVILMCLAEALLRVPDAVTADKLIQDKLFDANWQSHLGHSDSFFVNASTWGLMLSEGKNFMFFNPWIITLPGLCLFALALSINLLGDGLRDIQGDKR